DLVVVHQLGATFVGDSREIGDPDVAPGLGWDPPDRLTPASISLSRATSVWSRPVPNTAAAADQSSRQDAERGAAVAVLCAKSRAIEMSFSIRSKPNPESKLPESTNCLNFFWVELFMPVEAFSTSTISAGSSPNFRPITSASMPATKPAAETRLF